jgi:methylmalonyl-CoA mutase
MSADLDAPLGAGFPPADRDQWRALAAAVLAKAGDTTDPSGVEEALTSTTYDGIGIRPLYTADDAPALSGRGLPGHPPYVRGATESGAAASGWDVRTRHAGPDAEAARRAVLQDLETGATSLWLVLGEGALSVSELPALLDGVYLDLAPIALDAGAYSAQAAQALLTIAGQRGVDPGELRGTFGADPIGVRARTGGPADLDVLAALAALAALGEQSEQGEQGTAWPKMRVATVDGTVYADAGASDAQELGIATAVGVAYLRALTDGGRSIDDALAALEFRWSVGVEQFPGIAKLRAARRIWSRVAELSGAGENLRGQYQHAVTSAAMLTRRDPWVNMLRTTIACFSSAVGGADAITVAPFDSAIGVSDEFARRIARNTSAILHDESSLARVVDAAGGSWFVESLTEQLAERAWDVFVTIERAGGALAALDDGTIDGLLAATRARRDEDIAHRRAPITGVSEYAFVAEAPVERPRLAGAPADGLLPRIRYAEAFERLRDRADAAPQRPRVYLATLGPFAAHSARAGFAANLFQAGGIEAVTGPVDEFESSGIPVVCLCSSDGGYADEAAAAARSLRAAGARQIWLAGRGPYEGVDGYVFSGCDAVAVLTATLDGLGVPA